MPISQQFERNFRCWLYEGLIDRTSILRYSVVGLLTQSAMVKLKAQQKATTAHALFLGLIQ